MAESTPAALVAPEELLNDRLDRIRKQRNSKLANQKHLAIVLEAIDESLAENKDEKTPTAYFVSFLSLMDQSISHEAIENKEMAQSTTYFLDLIAPYISAPVLKSKFEQIIAKLSLALANEEADAPLLRSSIGALENVLLAQDSAGWQRPSTEMSPKRAVIALIQLGMDPRPKVRKRAQDAITRILKNPPPSPKVEHPASVLCAESSLQFVTKSLKDSSNKNAKDKDAKIIHALQLVRAVTNANGWPADKVEVLCETLLKICKTNEQYLVMAAFDVFEAVFKSITDEVGAPKLVKILDAIFDLVPSLNDVHIAPAWLAVVAQAGESYAALQPAKAFHRLPAIFKIIISFLESESENIQISASQCLVALASTSIPAEELKLSNKNNKKTDKILDEICSTVFGLLNIKYIGSWNESMQVLVALFDNLRWRADPHLVNHLKVVGALRSQESFEDGREAADTAIAAAIRALGPEKVLEYLPLNLENGEAAKTWLLPLLRDNIQFARLGHFISYFIPLGEWIDQETDKLKLEAGENTSSATGKQIKYYETLKDQVWSLLPRYMDLPFDLREAFDDDFAQELAATLYGRPNSRSQTCQSLRLLVQSNQVYASGEIDSDELLLERFPIKEAKKNVEFLAKNYTTKILLALFNVFLKTVSEFRSYVLECIDTYLNISKEADVVSIFDKLCQQLFGEMNNETTFKENKEKSTNNNSRATFDYSNMLSLMDLVVNITPYLPQSSLNALSKIFMTMVAREDHGGLQKKAFRILTRISETEDGTKYLQNNVSELEKVVIEYRKKVHREARAARLQAVGKLLEILPEDHMSFIPSMLPEVVLSTKDTASKTRETAYGLLVQMGYKMKEGGSVNQAEIPDVPEDAPVSEASLEEFFTMVSAGLAGDTPHMISATVTALSRTVFEFRESISTEFLNQLASTVAVFLEHNSREIVKSTLGFVKITAVSLPAEIVEPQLGDLVSQLLRWSGEHKAHFQSKIKHIIERLIRRFGYDKIAAVFPEEHSKLLTNIRKTKDRAKRNKTKQLEEEAAEKSKSSSNRPQKQFDNEYDQVMYGDSDDDSDDGESDHNDNDHQKSRKKGERYILEGEDEPLDLLDSKSLAHISSSKPRSKGELSLKHKFNKDQSGKIVIKEDDGSDIDEDIDLKSGIDAYVEALKSGPTKGQRNRLKYKRSRKHREDSEDEDDGDDEPVEKKKNTSNNRPVAKAGSARTKGQQQQGKPKKNFPKRRKL